MKKTLSGQRPWVLLVGVLMALFGFVALTWFVDKEVFRELDSLKSAQTDNIEWAMSQSEVEYLRFQETLSVNSDTISALELAEIRFRFDLFYSRIDLFLQGHLFAPFQQEAEIREPMGRIWAALQAMVPAIDGTDEDLIRSLPEIRQTTSGLRRDIRDLALKGVAFFASHSDAQREEISGTLTRLTYLTGAMLLAMGVLSGGLVYLNLLKTRQSTKMSKVNSRLKGILETSLDGVIVTNNRGEVLTLNRAAEQIFGYGAEDAMGVPIGDLIVPDHLRAAHRIELARLRQIGVKQVSGQGRVQSEAQRYDGSIFPIEIVLSVIAEGEEEVFVAFVRDISQVKADEKELIEARDRALAGEKAKTDFLTVMSHEIRTPLNGILGTLQLLFREPQSTRQMKMLRNMDISGQLLLRHVNAVLDISSTEAGKMAVTQAPLNPGQLVQDIIDAQSGASTERGNVIEWSWSGAPHDWILSDEHKLEQILLNLLGNAIKFTQDGRISISVSLQTDKEGKDILMLRVQDTGIGIAEDRLGKVFDDFQTFDASLGRNAAGTGLGLGIARRFAHSLGGVIRVESRVGQGSLFEVLLPVKRVTHTPHPETEGAQNLVALPVLNILVVDDNQINLDVIAAMLEHEGHHPTRAKNGPDAVDAAADQRFDVILMDVSMPGMDGLTATQLIRKGTGLSAKTPVFAVSANVLPEDTMTYLQSGMSGVLSKPLTFEALRSALDRTDNDPKVPDAKSGDVLLDGSQLAQLQNTLGLPVLSKLFHRLLSDGTALQDTLEHRDLAVSLTDLAMRCHNISGSAAMFGAARYRVLLNQLERVGLQGDEAGFAALVPEVSLCWIESRKALEVWHQAISQ